MSTTYQLGNGTIFSVSTDGTTFTPVHQLKSISISGGKTDYEDITNLDSPGATKEWAPTLIDSGNAVLDGVFARADAGQLAVFAAFNSRALLTCKVQFLPVSPQTTGDLTIFTAYVSDRPSKDIGANKVTDFKATLKITGLITETAGS